MIRTLLQKLEAMSARRNATRLRQEYLWREVISFTAATNWLNKEQFRWQHEYAAYVSSPDLQRIWDEVFKKEKGDAKKEA